MSHAACKAAMIAVVLTTAAILACSKSTKENFSLVGGKKAAPTPFQAAVRVVHNCQGGTLAATVPFHKKETGEWCWAACGEMVTEFIDPQNKVKQCTQAQDLCGPNCAQVDCCATPTPKPCVIPGTPTIDRHGFIAAPHPHPLEPSEIVQELGCNHHPFIYTWSANGGGGHQMVAVDFVTQNGTDYVITDDPDGQKSIPTSYHAYRVGYGVDGTDLVPIRKAQ